MTEPAVELVGAERFARTVGVAIRDLSDLADAGADAIDLIRRQAAAKAPRRTGELASSWSGKVTAMTAELVNTAGHAVPVQFGTRHMAARPFLPVDIARDVTPVYVDAVGDALNNIKGK